MLNWLMRTLLRSPLHGLVSRGLMLLTVTGRTSGRTFTFPVQYVERDGEILVLAGRATTKSWWRNLREPAPVLGVTERRFTERTPRIVRFDPDGTLDLDFGDNGSIRHPGPSAITVDDRGIIAVGIRGSRFQVARFSLDGVPDPSFGRGGVRGYCLLPGKCNQQLYDLGEPPEVEVDGAGNIVLALGGYSDRVSGEFGAVARLTAEGRRDQTFSNDGIAFGGSHVNESRSLVIQEDGAIVLTGYDFAGGGSGENYAFVARFENDGDLDESFGESGVVIATPGEYAWTDGTDVEATPDGKIVLLAEPAYDYLHDSFILARFLGA